MHSQTPAYTRSHVKGWRLRWALIQRSYMSNPPARKAAPCAATAGFG